MLDFVVAPTLVDFSSPFLNKSIVGIPLIPYFVGILGSWSILCLAIIIWSFISFEISSRTGPICLQGPHHSAQKSTMIGLSDLMTSLSKLSSVTDFGDFSAGGMYSSATMNSSTRGIFAGGYYNPGGGATKLNTIQYITIMTTGNSQDFGDMIATMGGPNGICCSPTRGIAWDGSTNAIQYITISTLGNSVDFGDATVAGFNSGVSFSSHTRGVAGGGYHSSTNNNWIEFVTISTTGNAQDFGDLRSVGSSMGGSSDCHGGIA